MRLDRLLSYADRLRASLPGSDLFIDARGAVAGGFGARTLGSAFQRIRRPDGTVVGAQGLLRLVHGADGAEPFDWPLFTGEASDDDLVALDRRCRTIHTLNFFMQADDGQSLHLCVHDRLLSAVADNHGRVFRRLVDALGVRSDRIVIDLPASVSADPTALAHVAANYSLSGFRVAVNPPSADVLVNLLDVARISVAKIDAPNWTRFAASPRDAAQALARVRERGADVHFKRVETPEQADAAIAAGATLVQGFFYDRPQRAPLQAGLTARSAESEA